MALFNGRGLGDLERRVLNVMVDWLFLHEVQSLAGLDSEAQAKGVLERLETRGLVARKGSHSTWVLTHAGRRVVR